MVCNAWDPAANGRCVFDLNVSDDYLLGIKHFCPECNSAQDAINFSVAVKKLTICYSKILSLSHLDVFAVLVTGLVILLITYISPFKV